MANKNEVTQTNPGGKKRRWYHNLTDSYRITKRTYPRVGWCLAGTFVLVFALFILYAYFFNAWISGVFFGLMFGLTLCIFLLGSLVRKASYRQISGMPGAVSAVLGQSPRGWSVDREPVAINPRSKEMVFRAVGRPGVVIITEGSKNRLEKIIEEQRRKLRHVANNVPVHVIYTGTDSGYTPLEKVLPHMRKLKKVLTNAEVRQVANRLSSVGMINMPIPKGIDPNRVRPNHKGMR